MNCQNILSIIVVVVIILLWHKKKSSFAACPTCPSCIDKPTSCWNNYKVFISGETSWKIDNNVSGAYIKQSSDLWTLKLDSTGLYLFPKGSTTNGKKISGYLVSGDSTKNIYQASMLKDGNLCVYGTSGAWCLTGNSGALAGAANSSLVSTAAGVAIMKPDGSLLNEFVYEKGAWSKVM